MLKKTGQGFTLIELMVVLAIIGVLTSVVVPAVTGMISKARDVRRRADIQSIALALEMFRDQVGRYPTPDEAGSNACGNWRSSITADFMAALVANGYLEAYPSDPINTGSGCEGYCYSYYRYDPPTDGVPVPFYVLGARVLEGGPDPRRANVAGATRDWTTEFHYLTWGRED